jgi:hypothetical protein
MRHPDNPNIRHDCGDGGTDDMPWDVQLCVRALLLEPGDAGFECLHAFFRAGG